MKYLDERFVYEITSDDFNVSGSVAYTLKAYNGVNGTAWEMYNGLVWCENTTTRTFDITDWLRGVILKQASDLYPMNVLVRLITANKNIAIVNDLVLPVYRYPHKGVTDMAFTAATVNNGFVMRQGVTLDLLPPQIPSSYLPNFWIYYYNHDGTKVDIISTKGTSTSQTSDTTQQYRFRKCYMVSGMLGSIRVETQPQHHVGDVVSDCGMFVAWQDRWGSMQMQPFSNMTTYSEGITASEMMNYTGTRSTYKVEVQPKFKVNSGWVSQTLYPYYESLFVSPWIKLYDATNKVEYDCILRARDYTEKTFDNQSRQLFNLSLDLEVTDKQIILQQ